MGQRRQYFAGKAFQPNWRIQEVFFDRGTLEEGASHKTPIRGRFEEFHRQFTHSY